MPIAYETRWSGIHAWRRERCSAMPHHAHDYVEMIYLKSGKLRYSVNFETYEMHAGDVIFAFPEQIHGHEASSENAENFVLLFPKNIPIYDAIFCNMLPDTPLLRGKVTEEIDEYFIKANAANRKRELPLYKGEVQGYIALILAKLLPELSLHKIEHTSGGIERRLIEYCSAHYREPISLDSVADALGYSPTHLSHIFSSKFKVGFSRFISTMRVEEAKKQLRGDKKITQIAFDCGFGSIRNFNRVFKSATGKSPNDYRKRL